MRRGETAVLPILRNAVADRVQHAILRLYLKTPALEFLDDLMQKSLVFADGQPFDILENKVLRA